MLLRCSFRTGALRHPHRYGFSTCARGLEQTRVRVPCRSNGGVDLDVCYPSHCSPRPSRAPQAALIYLPRGPLLDNPQHDDLNLATLRSTLSVPIVRINYRCNVDNRYPTAIHDVLAGYDWIVQNLCHPSTSTHRWNHEEPRHKLAVCGELLGGSLATTLALTECRSNDPSAVVAAAVNSPITNWVDVQEDYTAESVPQQQDQLTLHELHGQRKALFRDPAGYFDPFASPALFFRAAGAKVPVSKAPLTDMQELAELEKQDFFQTQLNLGAVPNHYASMEDLPLAVEHKISRKSSRRFPNKALSLRLPKFRVTYGRSSVLAAQSIELVSLLTKAMERQDRALSSSCQARPRLSPAAAELTVHGQCNGSGMWDDSKEGRSRVRDTALWLEEALQ